MNWLNKRAKLSLRGEVAPKQSRYSMHQRQYYVYLMANSRNTVIYTGVTDNIIRRVHEHKNKLVKGFTQKYNIEKLVYYEIFGDPYNAISREKQIKAGSRKKKTELIAKTNPEYKDLYDGLLT